MALGRLAAPVGAGDEPEQPTAAASRAATARASERGERRFISKLEFTVDLNAGPDFWGVHTTLLTDSTMIVNLVMYSLGCALRLFLQTTYAF